MAQGPLSPQDHRSVPAGVCRQWHTSRDTPECRCQSHRRGRAPSQRHCATGALVAPARPAQRPLRGSVGASVSPKTRNIEIIVDSTQLSDRGPLPHTPTPSTEHCTKPGRGLDTGAIPSSHVPRLLVPCVLVVQFDHLCRSVSSAPQSRHTDPPLPLCPPPATRLPSILIPF